MVKDIKEVWMPILGYESLYQVSSIGRVKSMPRIRKVYNGSYETKERILNPSLVGGGYPSVLLYKEGVKIKRGIIHILVANAFIPNPENKPCVNHKNGIKSDNRIENLEWVTVKENINHAFDTNLNKKIGKNDPRFSLLVEQCDDSWSVIREFLSTMDVYRSLGFHASNINHAIKNKIKSHGYYWRYK